MKFKIKGALLTILLVTSTFLFITLVPQKTSGTSIRKTDKFYISNGSDDGYVWGENETYNVARTTAMFSEDFGSCLKVGQWSPNGEVFYDVFRGFLKFDTLLPNGTTILSAKLCLYGIAAIIDTNFTIRLQKWTGDTPIDTGDYNQFDGISYDDGNFNTTSFVENGWNNITITNFDLINITGYTMICLRSERDIDSDEPSGYEYVCFSTFESEYSPSPYLEITYTFSIPAEPGTGSNYIERTFSQNYSATNFCGQLYFNCPFYNGSGKTKFMEYSGENTNWALWVYNASENIGFYMEIATPDFSDAEDLGIYSTTWHHISILISYIHEKYGPEQWDYYLQIDDTNRWSHTVYYSDNSQWGHASFGSIECNDTMEETSYLFFFDEINTCDFYEGFENVTTFLLNWTIVGDCWEQTDVVYSGNYALQVPLSMILTATVTPETAYLIQDQSQMFVCTPFSGVPPYQFEWYLNGNHVGTNSTTFTFQSAEIGIYVLWCNVTDAIPNVAKSNEVIITVTSKYLNVTITPLEATISVEQHVTFTSNITNGTSPYSYQWYLNANPISGANSDTFTFINRTQGKYVISLNVTDSMGRQGWSSSATVTVVGVKEYVDLTSGNPWLIGGLNGQLESYRTGVFTDLSGQWTTENITHISAKLDEYAIATEHQLPSSTRWFRDAESGSLTEFGENLPQGDIVVPSNFVIKTENFEDFNPEDWTIRNDSGLIIPAQQGYDGTLGMNASAQSTTYTYAYISRDVNAPVVTVTCFIRINDAHLEWRNYGADHVCLLNIDNGAAGVWLYYFYVGDSLYIYKLKATLSGAYGSSIELVGGTVGVNFGQWYEITIQYRKDPTDGWLLAWVDGGYQGGYKGGLTKCNTGTGNVTNVKVGPSSWLVYNPPCYVDASFDNVNITAEAIYKNGYKIVSSPTKTGSYALAVYSDGLGCSPPINHTEPYGYFDVLMEADVLWQYADKTPWSFGFYTANENKPGGKSYSGVYDNGWAYESAGWSGAVFEPNVWHHVSLEIKVNSLDEFKCGTDDSCGYLIITIDGVSYKSNLPYAATVDDMGTTFFYFGIMSVNYQFPPYPLSFYPLRHSSYSFVVYFDNLRIYTKPVPSVQLLTSKLDGVPSTVQGAEIDTFFGTSESSWKYRRVIIGDIEDCNGYWLVGGGYCSNLDSDGPFWIPFLFKVTGTTITNAFRGINFKQVLLLPFGSWYTGGWVSTITYCDSGVSPLVGKAVLGFTVQDYFISLRWYSGYTGMLATYDGANLTSYGMWRDFGGSGYPTASGWDGEYVLIGDSGGTLILWDGENYESVATTGTKILGIAANKYKNFTGWFENGVWRKYFLAVDGDHLFKIENKTFDDLTDLIGSDAHPVCIEFNGAYFLMGGDKLIAKGCFVDLTQIDYLTNITALDSDSPFMGFILKPSPPVGPEEKICYCLPLIFYILMIVMFFAGLYFYSKRNTWMISIPLIPIILWLIILQPKTPIDQMPIAFLRYFIVPPWHIYMAVILTAIACLALLSKK